MKINTRQIIFFIIVFVLFFMLSIVVNKFPEFIPGFGVLYTVFIIISYYAAGLNKIK